MVLTPLTNELMRDFDVSRSEVPELVMIFFALVDRFPGDDRMPSGDRCRLAGREPNDVWFQAKTILRSERGVA